jgi:hypothetical protein
MSKARLVVTAFVIENRPLAEVLAGCGVWKSWLYELVARYRDGVRTELTPQDSPNATPPAAST